MPQQLSLDWLLRPMTVDAFLDEIWGKSHYHASRDIPGYLDGLLGGADSVDALLAVFRPHRSLVSRVREQERKDQYVYRLADSSFDVAALEHPEAIAVGLDSLEGDLVRRGQCHPLGAGIADAVSIDDRTKVAKYQPLYARVTESSDGVALNFAQSAVSTSHDHQEAFRFLAKSTEPFEVCHLPGLSDAQRIELARTLILQGFLVRLSSD